MNFDSPARDPDERPDQHVVDLLGEEEAEREHDAERDQRLDQPRAQLDQVLHQRRLGRLDLLVGHAAAPGRFGRWRFGGRKIFSADRRRRLGQWHVDVGAAAAVPAKLPAPMRVSVDVRSPTFGHLEGALDFLLRVRQRIEIGEVA